MKREYIIIGIIAVVSVSLLIFTREDTDIEDINDNEIENYTTDIDWEEYGTPDEAAGTTETGGAETTAEFDIKEFDISPASVEINLGEAIEFTNKNDFPVYLSFERIDEEPRIDAQSSLEMRFQSTTYFTAFNHDTDNRIGTGSITIAA